MAPTIGVNLRVTGHCNQGSRKYMEDMFSVAYQQTEDELDLEYAYFGIFDGHGGHEAATFAKEHLMKAIVSQSGFWSDNDKDVLRAIKEGFIATHYAMWRNLENWPKTQSGWPSTSGTTASIAFIRRSNIYIGHVGDSCIVLGYQDAPSDRWKGAPLTMDHKPENPIEHKRINQAGGMVLQKSGVYRVVWHRPRLSHKGPLTRSTQIDQIPFLAVARSLGDLWSYNPDSDRFVVSPEPDVSVHHIDLTRDRCLIFGTDGLWNMLSPQEAVSIVKEAECNNKNTNNEGQDCAWLNPSKCLVDSALNKWTKRDLRADNISAVTLLLDPLGPPHSQVLDQQNSASQSQSEFVPYHIESYKINEGKYSSKLPYRSSGLAICTWYPHNSGSESLNKNDGLTTLSTMEELFGEKVEIIKDTKDDPLCTKYSQEPQKETKKPKEETLKPSTSKILQRELEVHVKKLPLACSTVLRNTNRPNPMNVKSSTSASGNENDPDSVRMKDLNTRVTSDLGNIGETKDVDPRSRSKENDCQSRSEENITKMKLRGSFSNKAQERSVSDGSLNKNCQKANFPVKQIRRNGKKGKKRKNYEVIKSEFNNLINCRRLRSKNKRRHSSLIETMNIMYEPRPKRRTRSEDQRKNYDSEEYKSDTENELEEVHKVRKVTRLKCRSSHSQVVSTETSEDNLRQNHLQERLENNSNNFKNQNNNNNNSNSNSNNRGNFNDSNKSNINNNSNNNNNNSNNNGSSGTSINSSSISSNSYSNNTSSNSDNGSDGSNNSSGSNANSNNSGCSSNSGTVNYSNNNVSISPDFTPMRLRSNMPVKTLRSRNINLENCDWFVIGLNKINVNPIRKSFTKQNCKSDGAGEVMTHKATPKITNILPRSSLSSKLQTNEPTQKSTVHTRSQNKRLRK